MAWVVFLALILVPMALVLVLVLAMVLVDLAEYRRDRTGDLMEALARQGEAILERERQ